MARQLGKSGGEPLVWRGEGIAQGWWHVYQSISMSGGIESSPVLRLSDCKALYLRAETFQRVSIHMHISAPRKAFPFEIREDNHVFEMSRYSPATFEIFIFSPCQRVLTVCITVGRNHGGICIYAH